MFSAWLIYLSSKMLCIALDLKITFSFLIFHSLALNSIHLSICLILNCIRLIRYSKSLIFLISNCFFNDNSIHIYFLHCYLHCKNIIFRRHCLKGLGNQCIWFFQFHLIKANNYFYIFLIYMTTLV